MLKHKVVEKTRSESVKPKVPGREIVKAEIKAISRQKNAAESYDVYVDDYSNYGDWYDYPG